MSNATTPRSKELTRRIWRRGLRLPMGQKAVLTVIMDHADRNDYAYPSLDLIAEELMISRTQAWRFVDGLVKTGVISKSKRDANHGHYQGNGYHVNVGNGPLPSGGKWSHSTQEETKVTHSEGFTSDSQSAKSKSDGPTMGAEDTGKTKTKTTTDPVNSLTPKLDVQTPEYSAPGLPLAVLVDLTKYEAKMNAPMPPDKTVDGVYLRRACDALRLAAPGVKEIEKGRQLPESIFKLVIGLRDAMDADAALSSLRIRLDAYHLKQATHVDQLERVLLGQPPANPPAPEKWKTLKPYVLD
jgi:biotin operon repressor